jgi:hypothetical protein
MNKNRLGDLSERYSSSWLSTSAKAHQSKMRFMQQKKEKEIRLNLSTAAASGTGNSIMFFVYKCCIYSGKIKSSNFG